MFGIIKNLTKAAVAVAIAPVDLAVDILTLPSSADSNRDPFAHVKKRLGQAGEAIDNALDSED